MLLAFFWMRFELRDLFELDYLEDEYYDFAIQLDIFLDMAEPHEM